MQRKILLIGTMLILMSCSNRPLTPRSLSGERAVGESVNGGSKDSATVNPDGGLSTDGYLDLSCDNKETHRDKSINNHG